MKRLVITIFLFLLFLPSCNVLMAQDKGFGGMVIETKKSDNIKNKGNKQVSLECKTGFQQSATFSVLSEFNNCCRFSIDYIAGWRFNKCLYAGIGAGVDFQTFDYYGYTSVLELMDEPGDDVRSGFTIPLYAHLRAYIGKKRWQPFVALSAGVDIAVSDNYVEIRTSSRDLDGGPYFLYGGKCNTTSFFVEPMVGLDFRLSSLVSLNVQLGANMHGVTYLKMLDATHVRSYQKVEGDFAFKLGCTF